MIKKSISVLLALIMVFGAFAVIPFPAFAAISGTTGDCTWTLSDDLVLTISGNGAMGNNSIEYSPSQGLYISKAPWGVNIKSVVIEDGVTSIGTYAFYGSTRLTSVDISDSVTSIGVSAFYGCTGLTSVDIPDSVTSIGSSVFRGCTGLTSIDIPDSVTSVGSNAFYNTAWYDYQPDGLVYAGKVAYIVKGTCPAHVGIKDGTVSITDYAFEFCEELTSIDIPDSVTSIGDYAFSCCTGLTSIDIPDSVTGIGGGAFSGTAWLNNQPDGLVYAGKVAYTMKGTCPSHVEIKDGTVGIAGYAFYFCEELTSIEMPNSVVSIGGFAFRECTGLSSIDIPDSVTSIESYTFYGTGLTSIEIPDSATSIGEYAFYGCTGLTSVFIPNSVTSLADSAFQGCTSLTSIEIPDSVTSIGMYAFYGCTGLTSVFIPNSVTSIGRWAFGYYYDSGDKHLAGFTIYGYENTAAETYANRNSFTFISIIGECDNCHGRLVESDYSRGYPATCTKDGLTDGYTCPSCGHKVEQTIIPKTGHKPVIDRAVEATCQSAGHTLGSYCEYCGEVYIQSEVIPKLAHTPVTDEAVPADCTHTGLTEGSHCSVCGDVIVAQTVIQKLAHTVVIDEAVPADCTHTGLTKGSHCSVCNEVIVAQNVIPITHKPGASVIENSVNPSCTSAGSYETVTYCTECGNEISRVRTTVKALGHDYIYLPAITATYFHAGQTEGIKCSRCGDWLIESHDIPMLTGKGVFCDIDGDEEISSVDVTLLMRWLADMNVPVEIDELWADVDDDSEVSVMDVTLIQRWLAGFPSSERIGALLG